MKLTIDTARRRIVQTEVDEVVLPGAKGSMGIQPGHTPLVSVLNIGVAEYKETSGDWERLVVLGGFVEVSDDEITVLADDVEKSIDIDLSDLHAEIASHEKKLSEDGIESEDAEKVRKDLELARARADLAAGDS